MGHIFQTPLWAQDQIWKDFFGSMKVWEPVVLSSNNH